MSAGGDNLFALPLNAALIVGLGTFAACHPTPEPERPNPKVERVSLPGTACHRFWGGCETSWKQCVGPDLIVHLAGQNHSYNQRTRNSEECQ